MNHDGGSAADAIVNLFDHVLRFSYRATNSHFAEVLSGAPDYSIGELLDALLNNVFFERIYAERKYDKALMGRLAADGNFTITGQRGSGKSTLLHRFLHTATDQQQDDLLTVSPPGVRVRAGHLRLGDLDAPADFLLWDIERIAVNHPGQAPATLEDLYTELYTEVERFYLDPNWHIPLGDQSMSVVDLWKCYRVRFFGAYDRLRTELRDNKVPISDPVRLLAKLEKKRYRKLVAKANDKYYLQTARDKFDDLLSFAGEAEGLGRRIVLVVDNVDYATPEVQEKVAEEHERLVNDGPVSLYSIFCCRPTTNARLLEGDFASLHSRPVELGIDFDLVLDVFNHRITYVADVLEYLKPFANSYQETGEAFVYAEKTLEDVLEIMEARQRLARQLGDDAFARALVRLEDASELISDGLVEASMADSLAAWHNYSIRSALFQLGDIFEIVASDRVGGLRVGSEVRNARRDSTLLKNTWIVHMIESSKEDGRPTVVAHASPTTGYQLEFLDFHLLEYLVNCRWGIGTSIGVAAQEFAHFDVDEHDIIGVLGRLNMYRGYETDHLIRIYGTGHLGRETVLEPTVAAKFFVDELSRTHYFLGLSQYYTTGDRTIDLASGDFLPPIDVIYRLALERALNVLLPACTREVVSATSEREKRVAALLRWRRGSSGTRSGFHYALDCSEALLAVRSASFVSADDRRLAVELEKEKERVKGLWAKAAVGL